MTTSQAVIIAVVQGLTEFLPVSSSAHIVLAKTLMRVETPGISWEVVLHLSTLAAILVALRRQVAQTVVGFVRGLRQAIGERAWRRTWKSDPEFRLGWYLIIGTVPAGVAGALFHSAIERLFSNGLAAMAFLFLTGEILWLTRPHSIYGSAGEIRWSDSVIVGLAQACALLPGISRSGSTIAAGVMRGVDRVRAVEFSFLLSIPAIVGAVALDAREILSTPAGQFRTLVLGGLVAGSVGYVALRLLFRLVRQGHLHWFAYYCWVVSVIGFALCWGMGAE